MSLLEVHLCDFSTLLLNRRSLGNTQYLETQLALHSFSPAHLKKTEIPC